MALVAIFACVSVRCLFKVSFQSILSKYLIRLSPDLCASTVLRPTTARTVPFDHALRGTKATTSGLPVDEGVDVEQSPALHAPIASECESLCDSAMHGVGDAGTAPETLRAAFPMLVFDSGVCELLPWALLGEEMSSVREC